MDRKLLRSIEEMGNGTNWLPCYRRCYELTKTRGLDASLGEAFSSLFSDERRPLDLMGVGQRHLWQVPFGFGLRFEQRQLAVALCFCLFSSVLESLFSSHIFQRQRQERGLHKKVCAHPQEIPQGVHLRALDCPSSSSERCGLRYRRGLPTPDYWS